MIILGLSGGHDANWCVVRDGYILGAFEKERFTRIRHDGGDVTAQVVLTLSHLGLTPMDIDLVATSEPVHRGLGAGHQLVAGAKYKSIDTWQHQVVEYLGRLLPAISVPHHLAHAAYAHYTDPQAASVSAVMTLDGGGDFYTEDAYASATVSKWSGSRLEWIRRVPNCDFGSLWYMYSKAIFGNPESAGKLMGLAAFGADTLVEAFQDRFGVFSRDEFSQALVVKNCWPDFDAPPFLDETVSLGWSSLQSQDIAYAVQALTTSGGLSLARAAHDLTGASHLAISGGVALNGYLAEALDSNSAFDSLWIPPAVDDGGLSVGCALFSWHHVLGHSVDEPRQRDVARLGLAFSPEHTQHILSQSTLNHHHVSNEEACDRAAGALSEDRVVGWFEGHAEHGPRALGGRSLLSPVDDDRHRRYLNREVKDREPFRPVAPVVREEDASAMLRMNSMSPYMMRIVPWADSSRELVPAARHKDDTARVQTVSAGSSFHRIASGLSAIGHTPVFINTSLNLRAPIANSPSDAIDTFSRMPITEMYLDGYWVTKK